VDITTIMHPDYKRSINDWDKWRLCYDGGDDFVEEYLKQFSQRENAQDFANRKEIAPIPTFAKASINDIKNAIYQRATDIVRINGSDTYQRATIGDLMGVDNSNSSMNAFIGREILPELLPISKVGVFVDMTPAVGETKYDLGSQHPYLYTYHAEDIRSWAYEGTTLTSVLLRHYSYKYDDNTGLPKDEITTYRLFQLTSEGVEFREFDRRNNVIDSDILDLPRIPLVIMELSQSLMADVANYQIGMLNLASSDISYAMKSNFPFYVEQFDPRVDQQNRRRQATTEDGTAEAANTAKEGQIQVGNTQGRRYPINTDRPDFIHPSSEPLEASMAKQEQMKIDIRQLVNLSFNEGLEGGLANIGLELERGEREIANIWAMYEKSESATITYPKEYHLESDEQRVNTANIKVDLMAKIPSLLYQKEMTKDIIHSTLSHKLRPHELEAIKKEIDAAVIMDNRSDTLDKDIENGLVGNALASKIRGYPKEEVEKAKIDHADRIARIQAAQLAATNTSSRGNVDMETDSQAANNEKKISQSKDFNQKKKVRGTQR